MTVLVERSLLDLAGFIVDNRGRTCPTAETGLPLIATNCLKEDKRHPVFENVRYVDHETYSNWFRAHPEPGDVLFVCKGSPGRVAIVPDPVPFCIAQDMVALRANPETVDPTYLYYRIRATDVQARIENMHVGTMIPHFKKGDFGRLRFAVHESLIEQKAIAEVLGALDDKIAANEHVARTTLKLGDSLFDIGRQPGEVRMTIGELSDCGIIEFGDGYRTKRSEHGQPGLRILRASDVRDFQVLPVGDDFVSAEYARQIGGKASRPGDVIMTTKGTVGRVAVVPSGIDSVVYSPQICYFRVRDHERLDVGHLAAWFRSADLESQTASLMYKSDMAPYINLRDIRSLSVPIPDPGEHRRQGEVQRALLDRFDACCIENERLASSRDELLPLLMSGKIRVNDAEAMACEAV